MNDYVSEVDSRYEGRVEAAGVTLIRGEGRFIGHKRIEVSGRSLTAEKIVVATGSRPVPPPFADLPVWTSDHLFPLRSAPPQSLIIIGGGVIGCEMAAFFAAVGVETSLFVRHERLLGKEDREIEEVFQTEFSNEVRTHFHTSLKNLTRSGELFRATFQTEDGEQIFQAECVLFATGCVPNTELLDLSKTGLAADAKGFLPVDEHLETAISGIYSTGDVNGRHMLQHAAAFEVQFLRQKFLKGITTPIDESHMPHAVFTHPEIAAVGFTEEQLKDSGTPYVAHRGLSREREGNGPAHRLPAHQTPRFPRRSLHPRLPPRRPRSFDHAPSGHGRHAPEKRRPRTRRNDSHPPHPQRMPARRGGEGDTRGLYTAGIGKNQSHASLQASPAAQHHFFDQTAGGCGGLGSRFGDR